ncbi:LysE/ArgO family amino acid transporter [Micromonospora sp. WMMD1102]|uniref:LysE/ArgO family amino acid transporter n=1 Tax=Micromonospora sp. WMMD1102 TaxID=3016105 RepID=UPI0024157DE5|nr:LysE/ArgO family amino acid transporter [Micromonospora sp. WMMD1102]MDG4786374.1 LysE/ArgO family amino acid transporter [Micromonospora sp. WMMD1102]
MVPVLVAGFGVGLSLIVAIGAQNAFVLRQGVRAEHVLPIVAICALSDALLILAGISGIGEVVERAPVALTVFRWAGAAFLVGYGLLAARRAFGTQSMAAGNGTTGSTLRTAVLTVLAMTWLNPQVYLDTVLLLGSIANTHGGSGRWSFGAGAALASIVWFTALGYGARLLGRLFARPAAWRVLDALIALTMVTIGVSLVLQT